jgi:DNA-binding transcriptional ArsR family regulator
MVNSSAQRELDRVFAALSDPTRRAMLRRLARGDSRVTELAAPHDLSLPAISKHLKVLERAGLVHRRREGSYHFIELRTPPLRRAANWLEFYARDSWAEQLERLAQLLAEDDAAKG